MADNESSPSSYSLTVPVPLTFPNLITPKAFGARGKETGEPKFSANFEFAPDSADLKGMKAVAAAVAKAKWPGRSLKELAFPFSNGDKLADDAKANKKDREFYRGKIVLAARSKYEPKLAGFENGQPVDYQGDARKAAAGKFYPGVEVLAQFNFVAYKGVGKNPDGVTAYLQFVFTTGKGERRSTGQTAAEVFKSYIGTASQENPFSVPADDGDEIPV